MFADYDAYKAAIIKWADNDDVTERVDDFIALVHVRLNRKLRLADMGVFAYAITTVDSAWVAKPPGYMGMRRLKLNGVAGGGLDYITFSEMDEDYSLNQPGTPQVYTIAGDRIRLGPIPNAQWELETFYWKRQPTLSATVASNVFLTEASDLLLYGALLEAETYLKDHEMFPTWQQQFAQGLDDLGRATQDERYPSGDLAMRSV